MVAFSKHSKQAMVLNSDLECKYHLNHIRVSRWQRNAKVIGRPEEEQIGKHKCKTVEMRSSIMER